MAILCLALLASCGSDTRQSIELFTNGTIYIDATTTARNLLVIGGVVAGIDVNSGFYPGATLVDLNGATAYPGFCDSHAHLMETGLFLNVGVNLVGMTTSDAIAAAVAKKAATVPEGGLILGVGFSLTDYDAWSLADLAKIDAASGNRLVYLGDKLGHNVVINSAAIAYTGLTPETPVPLGGVMVVEDGQLTGMLRESAMQLPSNELFKLFNDEDIKAGTLSMLNLWASYGYTSFVDLMGGPGARIMRPEIFIEMEQEGILPIRVYYTYTIFNLNDVDVAATYRGQDTEWVRFIGPKIFVDGAFAGGQAWTSWTNQQGNHGLQEIYTDDIGGPELNLNRIVAKVEEYGMSMHYHTQGDLAIDAVLDALDKVVAERGSLHGVHTLIHLAFVTDEQITRIRAFGDHVAITTQPGFWPVEAGTEYYYGARANEAYPIKKMIDGGLSVGISTDFSVSPFAYSPAQVVIGVAATGGGNPAVHEPLSVRDVIEGFSAGSARTTAKQDTGTLNIGANADIVVYDRDMNFMNPAEITNRNPRLVATYVNGRRIIIAN